MENNNKTRTKTHLSIPLKQPSPDHKTNSPLAATLLAIGFLAVWGVTLISAKSRGKLISGIIYATNTTQIGVVGLGFLGILACLFIECVLNLLVAIIWGHYAKNFDETLIITSLVSALFTGVIYVLITAPYTLLDNTMRYSDITSLIPIIILVISIITQSILYMILYTNKNPE